MTDLRKAAEMALDALHNIDQSNNYDAIEALRQALAEPEDPRIVELRTLMAEPTVTDVIFEVHRGPLSKSIREFGECPCPTQEPVGYAHVEDLKREHHDFWVNREQGANEVPLYTAPPKREWVGLEAEEVGALTVFDGLFYAETPLLADFIRAIEAKLKEKNGG